MDASEKIDTHYQNHTVPSSDNVSKIEMMAPIKHLMTERRDPSGNIVTKVLAAGNEYVIYEIACENIEDSLRVFIDGYTDASEQILVKRFAKVKTKYTEAKGLLYKSTNYGSMKNRIAHVLSSILVLDDIDGNVEFDNLIKEIRREISDVTMRKALYIFPTFLFSGIMFIMFIAMNRNSYLLMTLVAAALGGSLSILHSLPKVRFDEMVNKAWYFVSGCERVFLAITTSGIAAIVIKSQLIFQPSNNWSASAILIAAAFSESFVPSILGKIEKKA